MTSFLGFNPFDLVGKVVDGVSNLILEGRIADFVLEHPATALTFLPWGVLILGFGAQILKKGPTANFSLDPGTWKLLIAGCFTFSLLGLGWMGVIDVEDRIDARATEAHEKAPGTHSEPLSRPGKGPIPKNSIPQGNTG